MIPRRSLWAPLTDEACRPAPLWLWNGRRYMELTWGEWLARAESMAAALQNRGLAPGMRVVCLLTNTADACAALLATWISGGVVVSAPTPARGIALEIYAQQLSAIVDQCGALCLLADEPYAKHFESYAGLTGRVVAYGELQCGGVPKWSLADEDDVCFVQYSSGSTAAPKGCELTARAISSQLAMLAEGLDLRAGEPGVSWLPLSHDMGLFGCLMLHLVQGLSLALGTPERFVRSPRTWMADCSEFEATITAGPCFSVGLAARAARTKLSKQLSVRRLIIGGERVDWGVLQAAAEVFGPVGLSATAMVPAYGLAEATLAVSMVRPGDGARTVQIDAETLHAGGLVLKDTTSGPGAHVVSSGRPLSGVEFSIHGEEGVGEIVVCSPSLARGYLGQPGETAERFRSDGLHTGDIGFALEGELFVIGRTDDLITVGGRNFHAGDIEAAAQLPSVRAGNCAAVGVVQGGATRIVLLVEPRDPTDDLTRIAGELRRAVLRATGISVEESVFLERGALPKTPSGKLQRHRCRQLVAQDDDRVLDRIG